MVAAMSFIDPVTASDLVQSIRDGLAFSLEGGSKCQQPRQRRYPILVGYGFGVDAIADGLLIAVNQARYPSDPLEPGEGVDEGLAVRSSDGRQLRA